MKIVCISDTHGFHEQLQVPGGDLLLHAGDVSARGTEQQVLDFLEWFAAQPHPHKVFIAGNHDFFFEQASPAKVQATIPAGIQYLNDSGISIENINIWGSPVQPWFHDWAFNRQRGPEIQQHWQLIPDNTDLLLVHGPPYGIMDRTIHREAVGCHDLLAVVERIQPRLCVFGHIHEAYGTEYWKGTKFINASVLNVGYQLVNAPVVTEI